LRVTIIIIITSFNAIAAVDTARPQRKGATQEFMEKEKEMSMAGFQYSWRKMEVKVKVNVDLYSALS